MQNLALANAQTIQRRMNEIEDLLVRIRVPVLLVLRYALQDGDALKQLILETRRDQRSRLMNSVDRSSLLTLA